MISKEVFFVSIAFVAILFFSIGTLWNADVFSNGEKNTGIDQDTNTVVIEQDEFTMTAKYIEDNKWSYHITGSFDNKCPKHDVTTEKIAIDPELMKIKMVIYKPEDDILCAQAIKEIDNTGTFEASRNANIEFSVLKDESKPTVTGLPQLEE